MRRSTMARRHQHHSRHPQAGQGAVRADGKTAIDPVCGMRVDPDATQHHADHGGRAFHFCSAGCRAKFSADPERYLNNATGGPVAPADAGVIYTCPMHPQVRQVGPGACPICGMALEPETVTADTAPNAELADMTRRFWIALVLTLPVFALEMGGHLVNLHSLISPQHSGWVQFALATPVWPGPARPSSPGAGPRSEPATSICSR